MIPPKRFDISHPDWGMLRRSRCVQMFLYTVPFFAHFLKSIPVAPVAQRYHVTSDTLGREFDPGKRDFSY